MIPSKQTRIVYMFLQKLELLSDDERSVLIDAIALINNPRVVVANALDLDSILNTRPGSVS